MRNKIHIYSRISLAIVLAFLTSELLVQEVFLAETPRIRQDLADRVVNTSLAFVNIDNYRNLFQGQGFFQKDPNSPQSIRDSLAKTPLNPTAIKGVYAKETDNAEQIEIIYDEVDWVQMTYVKKDGTTEIIQIPAGTEPPPPGLY